MSPIAPCSQRIIELDGMRGLAVLMVLAWHFIGSIINTDLGFMAVAAHRVLILGRTGVDLFFVLSGFLITGILLDRTRSPLDCLRSFYVRRALRILPPYLLLIAIFWICTWALTPSHVFNDNTSIWYHLTFTQNYWMANHRTWGPDGVSVTWSVAIEEQFYLFYPLLMIILPRRWLIPLLISTAVFSAVFRYFFWLHDGKNAFAGYVFTLSRLDGLAIGGLVACCWRDEKVLAWLQAQKKIVTRIVLLGLLGFVLLGIGLSRNVNWHMFVWGHSFLSLFYGLFLLSVLVYDHEKLKQGLRSSLLRYFGRISYSIYLFHPLLLSVLFLAFGRNERLSGWVDVGICLAAFAGTLMLSSLLYKFIEAPCINKGRQFVY